jgi:ribosome-associated protein
VLGDGDQADARGASAPRPEGDEDGGAPPRKPTPEEAAHAAFATIVEKKGRNVLLLDITGCSDLADYMIIATATNPRQATAIAAEVDRRLRASGLRRLNMSGLELGVWAILDFGDLFIHVMQERERRYYDLEALWADGVVVKREAGGGEEAPAARAGDEESEDEEDARGLDEDGEVEPTDD